MNSLTHCRTAVVLVLLCGWAVAASAADIGQVKTAKGQVTIERQGTTLPATVGARLQVADTVKTGADGSVPRVSLS